MILIGLSSLFCTTNLVSQNLYTSATEVYGLEQAGQLLILQNPFDPEVFVRLKRSSLTLVCVFVCVCVHARACMRVCVCVGGGNIQWGGGGAPTLCFFKHILFLRNSLHLNNFVITCLSNVLPLSVLFVRGKNRIPLR